MQDISAGHQTSASQRVGATEKLQRINTNVKNTMEELIDKIKFISSKARTIVQYDTTSKRIDMQGPVSQPQYSENWANIQIQIGNSSVAGVICPFELDINILKQGLKQALQQEDMLEWLPEEKEEVEDEESRWIREETKDPGHKEASDMGAMWNSGRKSAYVE